MNLYGRASGHSFIGYSAYQAVSLLAILLVHELGHYVAARLHRVPASPPYFLPLPFLGLFGTLGAVITMNDRIRSRKALLDIGAAGPIAGMVVAHPGAVLGADPVSSHAARPTSNVHAGRAKHPLLVAEARSCSARCAQTTTCSCTRWRSPAGAASCSRCSTCYLGASWTAGTSRSPCSVSSSTGSRAGYAAVCCWSSPTISASSCCRCCSTAPPSSLRRRGRHFDLLAHLVWHHRPHGPAFWARIIRPSRPRRWVWDAKLVAVLCLVLFVLLFSADADGVLLDAGRPPRASRAC